jgi:hypothetical protein
LANFKINSRYTGGTSIKNREGINFITLRQPLNLQTSDGDVFITISKELINRPDLISSKAYGTPDLWWVIYEFNGIADPLFDLPAGTVLRIPKLDNVLAAIRNLGI